MGRDIVIELPGPNISRPDGDAIAKRGSRRLVKFVPTPFNVAAPAIWTSPPFTQEGKRYVQAVVLLARSPAQTAAITIPVEHYEQLPEIPVEW